jgi:hypothetical protein
VPNVGRGVNHPGLHDPAMGLALPLFHHVKAIPRSVISFTCQQQGNTSDKLANMIRWSISHSDGSFEFFRVSWSSTSET